MIRLSVLKCIIRGRRASIRCDEGQRKVFNQYSYIICWGTLWRAILRFGDRLIIFKRIEVGQMSQLPQFYRVTLFNYFRSHFTFKIIPDWSIILFNISFICKHFLIRIRWNDYSLFENIQRSFVSLLLSLEKLSFPLHSNGNNSYVLAI